MLLALLFFLILVQAPSTQLYLTFPLAPAVQHSESDRQFSFTLAQARHFFFGTFDFPVHNNPVQHSFTSMHFSFLVRQAAVGASEEGASDDGASEEGASDEGGGEAFWALTPAKKNKTAQAKTFIVSKCFFKMCGNNVFL
jgi:hypothetical protein